MRIFKRHGLKLLLGLMMVTVAGSLAGQELAAATPEAGLGSGLGPVRRLEPSKPSPQVPTVKTVSKVLVRPGVEVFLQYYTHLVKGKRVGLLTNPTGVDSRRLPTLDLLIGDPRVQVKALFAPEHGVRGDLAAGERVPGGVDKKSGLPVFSLYGGKDHRPEKVHLDQVDVIIYDIQDTGCRSYTYIWTLAEVMAAAGKFGKEVIVLDRPDPWGGVVVDGPVTEPAYFSFIGLYPVPRVYGMTVGELARYLNREHHFNCRLTVIPMIGWRRGMTALNTGLPWVNPSPRIETLHQLFAYSTTGSIGVLGGDLVIGSQTVPLFEMVGAVGVNGHNMAQWLSQQRLAGVRFEPTGYVNRYGASVQGVRLRLTDPARYQPVVAEMAIMSYMVKAKGAEHCFPQKYWQIYDKSMGTDKVRKMLMAGRSYQEIVRMWQEPLAKFLQRRSLYLIYK